MMDFSLQDVCELEKHFGSPLYVFDEVAFKKNFCELEKTFKTIYPKYRLSYSFKTNYTPYICSLINRLGGYAEIVSGMEYSIAKKTGFLSNRVIFNGPCKGRDGFLALLDGGIINIDNLEELSEICEKVKEYPERRFEVGLRANIDIGQNFISHFGMDENDLYLAFNSVSKIPNLEIVGLHCHLSRCRGQNAWRKRTETMLELSERLFANRPPKYIDLGSGMFGRMDDELKAQFDLVPSYKEYANVTANLIANYYNNLSEDKKPILFTEPGTTIISKYIDFIGRVKAIKSIRGKVYAILNCSEQNLGETCVLKKLPIAVIRFDKFSKTYSDVDFVGYTCLEQDVMYTHYNGNLGVGDYVLFGNVGGYSNVFKPPFILPNCAMIVKKENGDYHIIKHKEVDNDLLSTYVY